VRRQHQFDQEGKSSMKSRQLFSRRGSSRTILSLGLGLALGTGAAVSSSAQSVYHQISQDSFTNQSSQHMTEVEPGAASNGVVIVAAFQVGRIYGGGGADIGFATSLNSGISWSQGYLPGLTQWEGGGPNSGASDAAVAYNALCLSATTTTLWQSAAPATP
jgi:hypothetical protein